MKVIKPLRCWAPFFGNTVYAVIDFSQKFAIHGITRKAGPGVIKSWKKRQATVPQFCRQDQGHMLLATNALGGQDTWRRKTRSPGFSFGVLVSSQLAKKKKHREKMYWKVQQFPYFIQLFIYFLFSISKFQGKMEN